MKPLETSFTENQFHFQQVFREKNTAIYERWKPGSFHHFELIRIKIRPEELIYNVTYPERECYPSSEEWGKNAWTITDLEKALTRAKDLLMAGEEKEI